ncbi:hypothetical protein LCGC14_1676370 [marine sediment metagenome]|uniref:Uncharacterized protein n=1 Tax=marine sediment metagenome TaxID=412755 RepID=A0A0F9ICA1_9ZZZZ
MECENKGNYKYCRGKIKKSEVRFTDGKKVCENCFYNKDKWEKK